MNLEGPPLLLLLAVTGLSGLASPTPAAASTVAQPDTMPTMAALRAAVEERLASAGVVVQERLAPGETGTKTAQFFNFPQFPNYFRNCFYGSWRNC